MSTNIEAQRLDETAAILGWRYETLMRAGYSDREALLLATQDEVDVHLACDLLEHGCPTRTAIRILV
ncbi:MAG TPA: hypothetical protein VML54_06900 [Candidatus Limnocylindrales bacterium]|nr:hypothetical protein [Candidatus Limnocylindrales bacterium]